LKQKKVAWITGAGRGIGRGIGLALAGEGLALAGNDIIWDPGNTQNGLFEVKKEVENRGGEFLPVKGDVSSLEDQNRMIREIWNEWGRIDVLVNNAGVAPKVRRDCLETTPESFDRAFSVNTRGPFFLTQKVARLMIQQVQKDPESRPCIIFISSISAVVSSTSRAEYCISKAGVSQMSRIFAHRLAG